MFSDLERNRIDHLVVAGVVAALGGHLPHLGHDDGALEEAFIRSLSRESVYQRMLSGGTKVTREWIAYMTQIDYLRHMAFAITTVSEGTEKFVGVGRYVVDAQGRSADVALVIADAWQGIGLGRRLLEILPDHARAAGVGEMAGLVLATNVRMLRLARSLGCAVSPEPGDATLLRISKALGTDLHVDFIR